MNSGNEMLTKLRADAKELEEHMEKMCKPLKADLEAIRAAIAVYERKAKEKILGEVCVDVLSGTISPSKLHGLTHEQAVIKIAKNNGGIVRTQAAKRLMIRAGIMRETKNSTNMTHNAIKRTNKFERVSPGVYRLKEMKETPVVVVESEDDVFQGTPVLSRSEALESVARLGSRVSKPVQ